MEPAKATLTKDYIQYLERRLTNRLNSYLCEMESGYDDSITGFNEAWDIMRAIFLEELEKYK